MNSIKEPELSPIEAPRSCSQQSCNKFRCHQNFFVFGLKSRHHDRSVQNIKHQTLFSRYCDAMIIQWEKHFDFKSRKMTRTMSMHLCWLDSLELQHIFLSRMQMLHHLNCTLLSDHGRESIGILWCWFGMFWASIDRLICCCHSNVCLVAISADIFNRFRLVIIKCIWHWNVCWMWAYSFKSSKRELFHNFLCIWWIWFGSFSHVFQFRWARKFGRFCLLWERQWQELPSISGTTAVKPDSIKPWKQQQQQIQKHTKIVFSQAAVLSF